jgi:hypothetical protein
MCASPVIIRRRRMRPGVTLIAESVRHPPCGLMSALAPSGSSVLVPGMTSTEVLAIASTSTGVLWRAITPRSAVLVTFGQKLVLGEPMVTHESW